MSVVPKAQSRRGTERASECSLPAFARQTPARESSVNVSSFAQRTTLHSAFAGANACRLFRQSLGDWLTHLRTVGPDTTHQRHLIKHLEAHQICAQAGCKLATVIQADRCSWR